MYTTKSTQYAERLFTSIIEYDITLYWGLKYSFD